VLLGRLINFNRSVYNFVNIMPEILPCLTMSPAYFCHMLWKCRYRVYWNLLYPSRSPLPPLLSAVFHFSLWAPWKRSHFSLSYLVIVTFFTLLFMFIIILSFIFFPVYYKFWMYLGGNIFLPVYLVQLCNCARFC
jgi:hypothetical protein